jgi:hypothetical protein
MFIGVKLSQLWTGLDGLVIGCYTSPSDLVHSPPCFTFYSAKQQNMAKRLDNIYKKRELGSRKGLNNPNNNSIYKCANGGSSLVLEELGGAPHCL